MSLEAGLSQAAMALLACSFIYSIYGSETQASVVTPRLPAPGGSWTIQHPATPTLLIPAKHLDLSDRLRFVTGMTLFRLPWIKAPASTRARDGLGPLYNSRSCVGCHPAGGRGRSRLDDANSVATVARLAKRGANDSWLPHPEWGAQIQPLATFSHFGEAQLQMTSTSLERSVNAGVNLSLRKPMLALTDVNDQVIELAPGYKISARVAPALTGMGLLEAIPDAAIERAADPTDADGDHISGRVHWRPVTLGGKSRIGRFGWKALRPTVADQTGAAFRDDMGITNPVFSQQNCSAAQELCRVQPTGDNSASEPELPTALFAEVVFAVSHLAPLEAARATDDVLRGKTVFEEVGCGKCHTPSFETQYGEIWPYTDLLLHDMGDELADGRPEGQASGSEWRTPPLWGLGVSAKVSGHTTLLHDGRARNVTEAVLWHGGEAAQTRASFQMLGATQQDELVRFVKAL